MVWRDVGRGNEGSFLLFSFRSLDDGLEWEGFSFTEIEARSCTGYGLSKYPLLYVIVVGALRILVPTRDS